MGVDTIWNLEIIFNNSIWFGWHFIDLKPHTAIRVRFSNPLIESRKLKFATVYLSFRGAYILVNSNEGSIFAGTFSLDGKQALTCTPRSHLGAGKSPNVGYEVRIWVTRPQGTQEAKPAGLSAAQASLAPTRAGATSLAATAHGDGLASEDCVFVRQPSPTGRAPRSSPPSGFQEDKGSRLAL